MEEREDGVDNLEIEVYQIHDDCLTCHGWSHPGIVGIHALILRKTLGPVGHKWLLFGAGFRNMLSGNAVAAVSAVSAVSVVPGELAGDYIGRTRMRSSAARSAVIRALMPKVPAILASVIATNSPAAYATPMTKITGLCHTALLCSGGTFVLLSWRSRFHGATYVKEKLAEKLL